MATDTRPEEAAPSRPSRGRRAAGWIAAIAVLVLVPWAALRWLPLPYLWICLAWAVLFFARVFPNRRRRRGPLYLYAGLGLLVFAGVEIWQWQRSRTDAMQSGDPAECFAGPHEDLGYAPYPNARRKVRSQSGDEVIFDVEYTIGPDGLRVSPPREQGPSEGHVLFFGGSYTFGEGLENDETFPYRTEMLLEGRFACHNFGFQGYGPHQMLRAIEIQLPETVVGAPPGDAPVRRAVYLAIRDHISRVARPPPWDPRGPCYQLAADGTARFAGPYDEVVPAGPTTAPGRFFDGLRVELRKSYFLRRIVKRHPAGSTDLPLWAAVVDRSRKLLEARHEDVEFHVILWDSRRVDVEDMHNALARRGIRVHLASKIIPGLKDDLYRHLLHRKDLHPNAEANARMATYVVEEIVGGEAR